MASTPLYYYYGSSLLAFFFCTYLVQTLIKKLFSHVRTGVQLKHLPSPPSLPIIGHLHYFLLGSTSFAKKLQSLATRYGPLLQLNMGASTFILVSNANSAREILKTHELNFVYRSDFGTRDDNIYFGSGIIVAPYGTYWRYLKKLCMTKLLSTSQLNQFTHIREQEIMKFLQYLIKVSKEDEFCDLGVPITALINNVICRMAMSTSPWDDTGKSEKIKELIDEMGELAGKLSAGDILGPLNKFDLFGYGRKLKKAQAEFDELVEGIMKKHEENGSTEGRDLMDIMLETCNDPSAEVKLTRTDVKAFFRDVFTAGTETTSTAVKWAIGELINHPKVFKKLRDEICSVVGHGRLVKESDVQNLPYLQAVVKETLRLHPPSLTALRQSNEDWEINGFYLKGQTRILINLYTIMRDPSSWNSPCEFIPERFMVNSDSPNLNQDTMGLRGQNFDYFPFGSGRRACPGASLAMTMIHATIGALVQCFDWKVKGGDMVDMTEASGVAISLEMSNPLMCYPILHSNPFENV